MSRQLLPGVVRGIQRGKHEAADTVLSVEEVQERMAQCPTLLTVLKSDHVSVGARHNGDMPLSRYCEYFSIELQGGVAITWP